MSHTWYFGIKYYKYAESKVNVQKYIQVTTKSVKDKRT